MSRHNESGAHSVVDSTNQREGLCCGQTVDSNLLEAGDDAGAGHGFTLSHPEHPLIGQHQVTGHAYHHLTKLGDKKHFDMGEYTHRCVQQLGNSWH